MRGGVTPDDDNEDTPFNAAEVSAIIPQEGEGEEEHNLIDDDDAGNVFQDEEQPVLGYDSLDDSGSLHLSDLQSITRESGETTRDTGLSVSNPNLSMSSFSMGEPEGEEGEEEEEQEGGKRRKGKKTQKRRRGKKGGELPFDYNPNDRDPDADHN
jgi:hypothetical protein